MREERRQSPRVPCRIRCTVRVADARVSGWVLDVSDGGLCLLSPSAIAQHDSLKLHLDVPGLGRVSVHAIAWHVRRVRGARSGKQAWSAGAVLVRADPGYVSLLRNEALSSASAGNDDAAVGGVRARDLTVFKVRVKKQDGPRTRTLSLTALDEDEAKRLATTDLDQSWAVVAVEAA